MAENPSDSPGWIISTSELERLTDLFTQFEGAFDPLTIEAKEAKIEFSRTLQAIYEKVKPKYVGMEFRDLDREARLACRKRIQDRLRPFPSI